MKTPALHRLEASGKFLLLAFGFLTFQFTASPVYAADVIRSGTGVATLDLTTAWVGGNVPTSSDIAVWQSGSNTGTATLGSDMSWGGIRITDPGADFNIGGGDASILTLGSGGLDMASSTVDVGVGAIFSLGVAQTWTVAAGRSLAFTGAAASDLIRGSGALTLTGGGTTTFNFGAASYSGGTTIDGTNVLLGSVGTFGVGSLTIRNNVLIARNSAGTKIIDNSIVFEGAANTTTVGTVTAPARFTFSGGMDLGASERTLAFVNPNAPATSNLSAVFAGTTSASSGSLFISNGNVTPSTQPVWVQFGLVSNPFVVNAPLTIGENVEAYFRGNGQLGSGTALTVNGIMDVSIKNTAALAVTVQSLAGSGLITNGRTSAATHTVTIDGGALTSSTNFSGIIQDGTTAALAISKTGSSTQVLSGNNTYTGATNINGGTLLINGDQTAATGAVTVASGATLGGSGIIGGATTVQNGGFLSPGNSPGTLTLASLNFNDGATLLFEAGDLVSVTGNLVLNATWNLTLNPGLGWEAGGSTVLFEYGSLGTTSLSPTITDNTGIGGSYTLIDTGTSIILDGITAIPEPSSLLMAVLGFGALLTRRVLRRK